tara:strand:- start:19311 stop:19919 length:609 start_codon:yes stop_codon:yes gene_type:complete
MHSTYTYTCTNRLVTKENYQYTPWHGSRFVADYFENRKNYLKNLEVPEYSHDHIRQIELVSKEYYLRGTYKSSITVKLLSLLNSTDINNGDKDNLDSEFLEKLLQKFEVTKRIYSDYDNNFKPISKNYTEIINYTLFSIILLLKQQKSITYRYLNSALKLNDLIISISDQHLKPEVKQFIHISLRLELSSIKSLTKTRYLND